MIKLKPRLLIVFILAVQSISFSQTNIDFETGNLNGWTGLIGANNNSNVSFSACSTAVNPPLNGTNLNMKAKSYFSMENAGSDPYGLFSLTSPLGGSDVIRLGNECTNVNDEGGCPAPKDCAGTGPAYCSTICGATPGAYGWVESPAEAIEQTFAVTSANALLTYAWAAVLNDGAHPVGEEPYFEVKIFDQSGTEITCFRNRVIQKKGLASAGWTKSTSKNCWYAADAPPAYEADVYYRGWTTVNVLLSNYIGQNVKVRFAVAGCVDGGHFGYAYFDAKTGPAAISVSNATPCAGQTVTLTAPAGVSGAYTWSGPGIVSGAGTATITVNASGTYSLSVPTGTCTATMTATVTYGGGPSVTASAGSSTICNGGGPVILTAGGASTYSWSANAGGVATYTASVNPSTTTVYTVTGTTAGCSGTQTVQVTVTPTPTLNITGTTTLCSGQSTVLTASTSAGTYTWSPNAGGGSSSTVTVSPGVGTSTYTLSGSNAGCPGTNTISVTVNPNPTVTIAAPATNCAGTVMTLTASTTTGTYTWSTNAGGGSASTTTVNPSAGTVTYTLTGSNGTCTNSTTATVTVNPTPGITLTPSPASLCSGATTTITASGASTYTWSANAGGGTATSVTVAPGATTTYTVNATSGAGCAATKTISITVNAAPTLTLAASSATMCAGGSTTLSASGASTYTWTTSTGLGSPNSATTTATPATTTVYTLTGTSGGCNSSPVTATVNVTPLPTLTTSATSNSVCTSGSATLSVSGASTYTWSPAGSLNSANGSPVIATPTATTTYTVSGTSSGCSNSNVLTITVNPTPTINISPSAATVCPTGTATLTASGGSTYTWSPASTLNTANGGTVVATPTASTTYTVSGTSAAGCTNTNTVSVAVNPTLAVTVNSPTTCAGIGVVLMANGASSYTWGPSAGLSSTSGQTVTATGNTTTQYTVTGSSAGCTGTNTATVTINPQPSLTVSATATAVCSGTSATLTANGATTYSWAPAGSLNTTTGSTVSAMPTTSTTYFVFGTDGNGCKDTSQVSITVTPPPDVTALPATICAGQSSIITASGAASYTWSANAGGVNTNTVSVNPISTTVYTVTATQGACVLAVTTTVTVNSAPSLTLAASSYTICNGDSATLSTSGASTYTWTTGAGLNCTSCATPTANPTSTTVYTVTGDSLGCLSAPATVTVNVNQPPDVSAISNTTSVCATASATLTANGASSYTWSPLGSLSSATGSPVVATPTASTTYTLIGADANGCRDTSTISVALAPTPTISINPIPAAVCAGQSVVLNGGTANSYTWSSNAGSANTGTVTINPNANDTYTLIGSLGSCIDSATITVPVNPNPVITSSVVTSAPCGQSTGCVDTVIVGSGTPTYTYSWNGGGGSSTPQYCGQPSGIYTLTVTDANGCIVTQNISIPSQNGPAAPVVTASTNSVCAGGTVTMTVTPATSGVVYTWTDNTGNHTGTSYTVSNLNPPGNYTVMITATDTSINCSNNSNTSIAVVALPNISVTALDTTICSGQSTLMTAAGASTYTWSANAGGVNTNTVSVNPSGNTTYTVTGTSNGCTDTTTFNVSMNPSPTVTVNGNPAAVCVGTTVTLTASGAANYTWLPSGSNAASITDTVNTITTYTISGVDMNGCTSTQQVITINVNSVPTVTVTGSQSACSGGQINTINYTTGNTVVTWTNTNSNTGIASSGTGDINGYNAPNVTTTQTGTITAIPTDTSTGCTGTAQNYVVTIYPNPTVATLPTPDSAKCGVANGGIDTVVVIGGTPAYTYQWYDSNGPMSGQTNSSLSNVPIGTYTVVITDQNSCIVPVSSTTFTVDGTPAINTSITPPLSQGQAPLNVSFSSVSTGATTYSWNFGNGQSSNAAQPSGAITYTAPGTYTVMLDVYNGGCHAMDTALVIIDATPNIAVPNIYSPNGDGINDTWFVTATGYCKLHCDIYNRWGQLVYQLLAVNDQWSGVMNNGNQATEGTYYYILEATSCDGKNVYKSDGWITLVK